MGEGRKASMGGEELKSARGGNGGGREEEEKRVKERERETKQKINSVSFDFSC